MAIKIFTENTAKYILKMWELDIFPGIAILNQIWRSQMHEASEPRHIVVSISKFFVSFSNFFDFREKNYTLIFTVESNFLSWGIWSNRAARHPRN